MSASVPDDVFNEIKNASIEIWSGYDNTYGYADEKINRINEYKNIGDNAWFIVSMFDLHNRVKLLDKLSPETKKITFRAMSQREEY